MRQIGPKNKLARKQATDLSLKTPGSKSHASLLKRLNILPGQHGTRGRRKITERGRQLKEKQRLRYLFGLTEKQLKNYFKKASKKKGNTALYLSQFLERRLDNIVYRLGFAPTRASARQLVSHGHVKVDDQTVDVPSYQVIIGDEITFKKENTLKIPYIELVLTNKSLILPEWLEREGPVGKLKSDPAADDIEKNVDIRSVIEFYSR